MTLTQQGPLTDLGQHQTLMEIPQQQQQQPNTTAKSRGKKRKNTDK